MRYRVCGGIIIKSENAAKPISQTSKYLQSKIAQLSTVESSFDYGCGKLRYAKAILKTTNMLCMVDSEIQLSRTQMIHGNLTNIRVHAQALNNVQIQNVSEFDDNKRKFDRGFCINVLSAIPIYKIRKRVIRTIKSKLHVNGCCLFTVQYRNSDFSRMSAMQNACIWNDGILIDSLRGHSFYALIRPESLEAMVMDEGLKIEEKTLHDGSVYLWAKKTE